MIHAPTNAATNGPALPRWGWSGVSKRTQHGQDVQVEQLVAVLPATKSSTAEIVAGLVHLRARFAVWLHQDEFGPGRGEQVAALKAHIKSVRHLCRQLSKGSLGYRTRLDAALRNGIDGFSPALAALGEAASLPYKLQMRRPRISTGFRM